MRKKKKENKQQETKVNSGKKETNPRNIDQVPDEELKDQRRADTDYRNDLYERTS